MAKLSIQFEPKGTLASISIDESHKVWLYVRRTCEEASDEVHSISLTNLTFPRWAFLKCYDAVKYYARRYDLEIDLEPQAQAKLEASQARISSYEDAKAGPKVTPEEIEQELITKSFERKLTNEQLRNVAKLYAIPNGATFSVPGAGKTTEALAIYFLSSSGNEELCSVSDSLTS